MVLYLVNAAEDPADAGYVEPEMQILALDRQAGPRAAQPDGAAARAAGRSGGGRALARRSAHAPIVRDVIALDAFARCWVQEGVLLSAVEKLLPPAKHAAFARVAAAWREKNLTRFHAAMEILAAQLARAVIDREVLGNKTFTQRAREFVQSLGLGRGDAATDKERAMAALAERLDADIRATTDKLIELHGLEGHAAAEVLRRLQDDYAATEPVSEGRAALLGGLASGALVGLKADLAAGGLTFGAGVVAGGIAGALGAAGLARGYNIVRGGEHAAVRWSSEFFVGLVRSALLRYLAVAHYGRGRGDFVQSEHPTFWQSAVAAAVESRRNEIADIWEQGRSAASRRRLSPRRWKPRSLSSLRNCWTGSIRVRSSGGVGSHRLDSSSYTYKRWGIWRNFNPARHALYRRVFVRDATFIPLSVVPEALLAEQLRRAVLSYLVQQQGLPQAHSGPMLAWRHNGFPRAVCDKVRARSPMPSSGTRGT